MAPPKRQTLPKPLPEGFILTDAEKKQWRLGRIIGQGGFGLIYLASQSVDRPVPADSNFVIKVEYHENGPLFSELKFYQRAAKKDSIQKWMRKKSLDFLGIPTYWGHGSAQYKDLKYRFMAMDRLGSDLQKICGQNGGRFKPNTVLQLGQRLVDVLEYIHVNEYVHADIKAANLMQGHRDPHQVYLADYGLSYRYCPEGVHKEYKEDPKKGHDGTIEYTSLDAHRGVASSRRSDLQILGFCLLHWLCGSLPWDKLLNNPVRVQEAKTRLMQNLPESVQELSSSRVGTDEVVSFLLYVKSLDYKDKPDYQLLKGILCCSGGELDLSPPQRAAAGSSSRTQEPQSRNKKTTGRSRGQARAEAMEVDADGEEEEEEQRRRPKQIPAKYLRGPPIYKPQQIEGRTLPERSVHHNSKPFHPDDQDEDEEQIKPKPIAAHYLRGPPTGPRDDSDQQAKTKPRTSERRPTWRQDMETATNGDVRTNSYRDDKHWREYEPSRQFLCEECGHRAGLVHTNRTGLQFWCLCAALFGLGLVVALITTHFYSVFTSAPPFSQ